MIDLYLCCLPLYCVQMTTVRIKICGITRVEDALVAANLGVDAIGLVFYDASPRAVSIEQARVICASLPPFVTTVGLFVNAQMNQVEAVLRQVPLDLLQFHGDEPAVYCGHFKRPYIKAVRMKAGMDLPATIAAYVDAQGVLLDTYVKGVQGGTGQAFNWADVPDGLKSPIILAGGLNADNIAAAIARVNPWAVDVSGGVEAAAGIKDPALMTAFVQAVKSCRQK